MQVTFCQALAASPQPLITLASSTLDNGATVTITRTQTGSGASTLLYPTATAPASSTFANTTPTPVYNPPTSAVWPYSYSTYTSNVGNGINPQYISSLTPVATAVTTNPYASGSATLTANQAGVMAGTSTVLTVTASPGTTPASTGLAVAADLSAFGGSVSQPLTNTTGNTFTYTLNVPAGQASGAYTVHLAVTDAQGRTGGGSVPFTVIAPAAAHYFAETEPNDTKATSPLVTLATASQIASNPTASRGVWGTSTGTSGAGVVSVDSYHLKTVARPPGIYLNSMSISGGTDAPSGIGHLGNIRGLNQTISGIGTTDTLVELSPSSGPTIPPSRTNYWYGFGKQEELYYRVTGTPFSSAEYTATFDSQQVFPEAFPGNPAAGAVTFARDTGNNTPMAFCLYDSNLNPIAGSGAANITTETITRTLPAGGPYYIALTPSSIANNLALGSDSPSRTFPAMDFANVLVGGTNTVGGSAGSSFGNLNMVVTDSSSTQYHLVPAISDNSVAFHIYWYQVYVGAQPSPVVTGTAAPAAVIASDDPGLVAQGGYSAVLTATVTPGSNPTSTGLAVQADLSSLGGSMTQAMADQFNGTFTHTLRVPASQTPGVYIIPITVTDAQARSTSGIIPLRVLPAPAPGFVVESEPNDTPGVANPVSIAPGGGVYGRTTGTGSSPIGGDATSDNFIISTSTAAPGIYRNRLTITSSGMSLHSGSIRGRKQVGGFIDPYDQITLFQTSSSSTAAGFNQWYSFGRGEQVEYRVDGNPLTTAEYVSTFTRQAVTPIVVPGAVAPGSVTIQRAGGNASVLGMWVYDSNLNPIDQFGGQGLVSLTRTLTPGTYYLAVSDVTTANNQPSPTDSSVLSNPVLGQADEIANNSTATNLDMTVQFTHPGGVATATGTKGGPFDIVWYQFTVSPPVGACCRGATCIAVAQANCLLINPTSAGATFAGPGTACGTATAPCCYANYNNVNGISVQDIFDYLNDWFIGSKYALTGGNGATGTLSVQNIFDFLNAWFAGGC